MFFAFHASVPEGWKAKSQIPSRGEKTCQHRYSFLYRPMYLILKTMIYSQNLCAKRMVFSPAVFLSTAGEKKKTNNPVDFVNPV